MNINHFKTIITHLQIDCELGAQGDLSTHKEMGNYPDLRATIS